MLFSQVNNRVVYCLHCPGRDLSSRKLSLYTGNTELSACSSSVRQKKKDFSIFTRTRRKKQVGKDYRFKLELRDQTNLWSFRSGRNSVIAGKCLWLCATSRQVATTITITVTSTIITTQIRVQLRFIGELLAFFPFVQAISLHFLMNLNYLWSWFRCPIASLDCMEEFTGQTHIDYGKHLPEPWEQQSCMKFLLITC